MRNVAAPAGHFGHIDCYKMRSGYEIAQLALYCDFFLHCRLSLFSGVRR